MPLPVTLDNDPQGFQNPTEDQAKQVLTNFQTIEPTIQSALSGLVSKKAALASLPIGGAEEIALQDLQALQRDSSSLEKAFLDQTPVSQRFFERVSLILKAINLLRTT